MFANMSKKEMMELIKKVNINDALNRMTDIGIEVIETPNIELHEEISCRFNYIKQKKYIGENYIKNEIVTEIKNSFDYNVNLNSSDLYNIIGDPIKENGLAI